MRKYLKYLFIPLLLIVGILAARGFYHYQKQYTVEEWFQKQESYISNLRTYVGEMDDVFALYIAGSIQEDDFLNHISVLQGELDIIQGCYKKEQTDHPVRTGTYTYEEKLGCATDQELVRYTAWAMHVYMAGIFSTGFQVSCQQSFVALGQAKISLFTTSARNRSWLPSGMTCERSL